MAIQRSGLADQLTLERHGHEERIDRRTLEAQGMDREPTTHRGPHVDAIERRGVEADNTRENSDRRAELAELRASLSKITRDIAAERNELAAEKHHPEPANNNQPEATRSAENSETTIESAREPSAGTVGGAIGGAADAIAETALKIVGGFPGSDQPTPAPTKEAADALKQQRLEHAERMLNDREYRQRVRQDQEKQRTLPPIGSARKKTSEGAASDDREPGRWRKPPAGTKTQKRRQRPKRRRNPAGHVPHSRPRPAAQGAGRQDC